MLLSPTGGPGLESWLHFSLFLLAGVQPRRQQVMAEEAGSLLSVWKIWIEFLVPSSGLTQPELVQVFEG